MNKRTRNLLLLGLLLLAVFALSGCSLPTTEQVDLDNPPGLWQAIIVYPLVRLLMLFNSFIEGLGIPYSWGWSIILLTLLLKLVTLPLTRKQLQSTKATQDLQPRLAELQAKYGKDRQKLSEEQMKLYKEAGVNPMGGCLPLLIQMPILFGLYQALYILASQPEFANAQFFWIPNLALPSQTPVVYEGVNFQGTNWIQGTISTQQWALLIAYFSLPIVMLVTQILMQKMSQPPKSKICDRDQVTGRNADPDDGLDDDVHAVDVRLHHPGPPFRSDALLDDLEHPEHHSAVLRDGLGRPGRLVPDAQAQNGGGAGIYHGGPRCAYRIIGGRNHRQQQHAADNAKTRKTPPAQKITRIGVWSVEDLTDEC